MAITDDVKQKMWSASSLARAIDSSTGQLPPDYRERNDYKRAGFKGEVYVVAAGIENNDAGLVGVTDAGIVMAFRGTEGTTDWINNFRGNLVEYPDGGKVHTGFYRAVNKVKKRLLERVKTLAQTEKTSSLYLTGHSKGGAMAALMAVEVMRVFKQVFPKPTIVTFGAPRVGDADFVKKYTKTACSYTRLESCRDIVPHLPLTPQECALMKVIFENVTDFLSPFLASDFCGYAPSGDLVRIIPDGSDTLCNVYNKNGETLNSLYHIMIDVVLKGKSSELGGYHTEDYNC